MALGAYEDAVQQRLVEWQRADLATRLWAKDPTVWFAEPRAEITDRLGWLDLPDAMRPKVAPLKALADEANADGFLDVVLLGMGGSSLAPEVYFRTFGAAPGQPDLVVLDSTHPGAVMGIADRFDPATTLFVVSSKSGSTLETLSGFRFFWEFVAEVSDEPGTQFIAVTDPGSSLEALAADRGFRAVFRAPSDVGGRYSALTEFGLVPAALIGADIDALLDRGAAMAAATGPEVPVTDNPALRLGAAMGELALAGRDKLTYIVSPALTGFPDWAEQLVAESTGKDGRGIVPVAHETLGPPEEYDHDRFFVHLALDGEETETAALQALQNAGHPVVTIRLGDVYDLAAEMFRAEMATAAAGAVLGIHPFDQPDVQLAKTLAQEAMAGPGTGGPAPPEIGVENEPRLAEALRGWLGEARSADYLSIQAYLPADDSTDGVLQSIRSDVRRSRRLATTAGYGPRFLHSTGQLHKGGPNTGLFLQIVDSAGPEVPVPETDYTFGRLVSAQAIGDYRALEQRQRRVLRVNLGDDIAAGLGTLRAAFRD